MSKRKADAKGDGESGTKKPAVKKIPKLLKAKITALLGEADAAMDITTIKLFLADKWEYPDSAENKNKVWKALKDFQHVGGLYHAGEGTPSYLSITPEEHSKAAEEKKKPKEKFTCPIDSCSSYDYNCQVSETIPGPYPGSTETMYKCLNECFREFKVLAYGNKRIYTNCWDEVTEKTVEDEFALPVPAGAEGSSSSTTTATAPQTEDVNEQV